MDLATRYTNLRLARTLQEREPLAFWRFAVPRLRTALAMFTGPDRIDELAMRGPNKGTKTETVAAYVSACLEKRKTLDLCPLPQWRGPVEGLCAVLDFKQQLLSVQPAYQRMLGQWPCRVRRNGEAWASVKVLPLDGDEQDETTWSVLHFLSQENRATGTGARADVVQFDEPPRISILRELRKAGHAGRLSIILVDYTPTIRSQWSPLREEYGDNPRNSITRINPYTAEVRWSLTEVADWVLSRSEKAKMLARYERDPIKWARIHGDFSNDVGLCAFHVPTLLEMRKLCRPPTITKWQVAREATAEGRTAQSNILPVQIWREPRIDRSYYIPIDPASGIDDTAHDPLALHVTEMGSGDLVARFAGYVSPYAMGVLAAVLARQYNNATVQPEINDGWATGVFSGLRDSRYFNIGKERRQFQPGKWYEEEGFRTNQQTRPGKITANQQWIEAWGQGVRYGECPSVEVIDCLMDCILDENGKAVAAPGYHDEDMILRGQSLQHCVPRGGAPIPERPVTETENQRLVRMIQGKDEEHPAPRAPILRTPRRGRR